ncbi:MAG: YifB family Mg chelatase-like AAA ATPase [Bacteroidetes bacterium]|nr:YifB family Mg chelatase-like AAA ATPase [Bacteroidota bacterium]
MVSQAFSAATLGVDAFIVEVECNLEGAMPGFVMVGLPDSAVRESRERVAGAIRNSGYNLPPKRITINLAPADIRKEGSAFDLPIALGVLAAFGKFPAESLRDTLIIGELSLEGRLRPVKGSLPIAYAAGSQGFRRLILPAENALEAAVVSGLSVIPVATLQEAVQVLAEPDSVPPYQVDMDELFSQGSVYHDDFSDVKGQENVKRALEVAASGGHNIIMVGPPGSGKTMLARRIPSILPPLSLNEALECTKIHSVAGMLPGRTGLLATRPFRSPHHTVSDVALVGGGHNPRPGEISLSHNGVLFLDELPEFARNVLEVMRQPLEDGRVTISRAALTVDYPARFMLVASMNPCPCGYYTDPAHACTCQSPQIQKYMSKISGPLMDRIDIHVEVAAVGYRELSSRSPGEPSGMIRSRVIRSREIQTDRFQGSGLYCNAQMKPQDIRKFCRLDESCQQLLKTAMDRLGLSARAYDRILKVSRTIADLDGSDSIRPQHLSEAIQYRSLDRNLFAA